MTSVAAVCSESFDRDACREHLGGLLAEEIEALRDLEQLLAREHEVLGAKNVAAIERIATLRQEMMGSLARIEERRRTLCTLHGHTPDWVGLEDFMQWCDPRGSLLPRLRECAQRATNCRDLNNHNGTLVAARLKHVEGLLAALNGSAAQAVTYGPNGASARLGRSRELGAA